jgi:hypothetical protein
MGIKIGVWVGGYFDEERESKNSIKIVLKLLLKTLGCSLKPCGTGLFICVGRVNQSVVKVRN